MWNLNFGTIPGSLQKKTELSFQISGRIHELMQERGLSKTANLSMSSTFSGHPFTVVIFSCSKSNSQYDQKSSSYLNAKLYKAFFNDRFSITLEANDIFNKSNRDVTLLNKDVTIYKFNTTYNRTFMLTLQYTFNSSRDRYRGQGAGTNELNRFYN